MFTKNGCEIFDINKNLIATASLENDLFKLDISPKIKTFCVESNNESLVTKPNNDLSLWHRRFGHASIDYMSFLKGTVKNFNTLKNKVCVTCVQGKQSRLPFKSEGNRANQLLELVHSDVWGPCSVKSFSGKRYFVTFVDDFSRKLFVVAMKNKSEVFDNFKRFKTMAEKQTGHQLKILRSDNGTEYCNKNFQQYFENNGILHQRSTVNTPQQNGVAERVNRTIVEKIRCMLLDADLDKNFWVEALMTAAYILNRIPCKGSGKVSPEELWTNKKPIIGFMKVFGCRAFAQINANKRTKLDRKSSEYIFVGYCEHAKAYRLFDKRTKSVIISRDVTFLESKGEKVTDLDIEKSNNFCLYYNDSEIGESGRVDTDEHRNDSSIVTNSEHTSRMQSEQHSMDGFDTADDNDDDNDKDWVPDVSLNETLEPRHSERNLNRMRPAYNQLAFAFTVSDPMTVRQAMDSEHSHSWNVAMKSEFDSLQKNKTWQLVELPEGKSPVHCKWVFRSKRDIHGNVIRYKARLVAKGFTQIEGIDYHDTFSPVVRYSSIRFLMAIAAKFDLEIRQLDVETAFLHGELEEEIFMTQPENFEDGTNRYCKLLKSLYGLKQSSRVWNNTLNKKLIEFGLKRSMADQCIYFYVTDSKILIVAIYVDDILVFSNDVQAEQSLVNELNERFNMKDLGHVSSVLGIRVTRDRKAGVISLDQMQYIADVLKRFNMDECKSASAPMDPNQKIAPKQIPTTEEEKVEMKRIPYRQAVGALLFCSQITRPDINFVVNMLSRYNENPEGAHWTVVKRVFRYLKGTIDRKITYTKENTLLEGFCDADWGSDELTRKSTSGYVFTLQGGAVSWCTKRQKTIALSTTEAEFQSMVAAIQEAIWLKRLEKEIFVNSTKELILHCDNKGAIQLANNNSYSAKTKHIDIKEKFVKEKIENGQIKLEYLKTNEMPADILTKSVSGNKLKYLSFKFGLN